MYDIETINRIENSKNEKDKIVKVKNTKMNAQKDFKLQTGKNYDNTMVRRKEDIANLNNTKTSAEESKVQKKKPGKTGHYMQPLDKDIEGGKGYLYGAGDDE